MYYIFLVGDPLSCVYKSIVWTKVDMDIDLNAVDKKQLLVEETDDSCRVDSSELIPPSRDTDGSCTTECVSGDWFGEVREVELPELKQEPHYVCCVLYPIFSLSQHRICTDRWSQIRFF